MSASASDNLFGQTRNDLQENPAQSALAKNACKHRSSTSGSGQQCDSVKNRNLPRAAAAPSALRAMSCECCEYSRRGTGSASSLNFAALREIRRPHQDDFEAIPVKRLGLPALPAALPLAAMIFQGDDDGEQRRDSPGFCVMVRHGATIGSEGIRPSNLFRAAAGSWTGEQINQRPGPGLFRNAPPPA